MNSSTMNYRKGHSMSYDLEIFMNGQQFKKLYEKECDALLNKYCLRRIELEILFFLSTDRKCDTAKEICSCKYLSKAHISKAIDNLTQQKFIETTPDKVDRRCVRIRLTEGSDPIIEEMKKVKQKIMEIIYLGVTEEEKEVLSSIAMKISYNILNSL